MKENQVSEMSSTEKKFNAIVLLIGAIAILIIILVNIPWNGSGSKIMKEYDYLEKNHVFVSTDIDELKEKIENGDEFQLYIGNGDIEDANYFVYYADQLAKKYGVEEIYYLSSKKMSTSDLEFVRENSINELSMGVPNMIFFEPTESGSSKASRISGLEDFEEYYGSNYWLLLEEYFKNCYE